MGRAIPTSLDPWLTADVSTPPSRDNVFVAFHPVTEERVRDSCTRERERGLAE